MHEPNQPPAPSDLGARLLEAIELLEAVDENRSLLAHLDSEGRKRLLIVAGKVSHPDMQARRQLSRAQRKQRKIDKRDNEEAILDQTAIRKMRENPIFATPRRIAQYAGEPPQLPGFGYELPAELEAPAEPASQPAAEPAAGPIIGERRAAYSCYVCRQDYSEIHWFYDQMCAACGDFNHSRRDPVADLSGRIAVVTGARVKIGFQSAIMLLRNGCRVVVATRFPRDAARRYAAEPDFAEWGHRLEIHGLDLRHIPSVEAFCQTLLRTLPHLDYIINNACQTVRRPPGFYGHLMERERSMAGEANPVELRLLAEPNALQDDVSDAAAAALTADRFTGILPSAEFSQVPLIAEDFENGEHLFPTGRLDADEQQVDLRNMNSWRLKLADVETVELLEVHVVNAVAPFILNARLKPLMERVPTADKHIVNVSAMEGQFYRTFKSDRHPHTNMAKASLNMMTRTSAADYIESGIHMNSVDTGWVTDEDPAAIAQMKRDMHRFHPPLDIVDGAARIVDPIFDGLRTGKHVWGQFLKDYRITDW